MLFRAGAKPLKYPNLLWAISQFGDRYKFAAMIRRSESWLSRRLKARVAFSAAERDAIAESLGYPADWLFQEPQPPARVAPMPESERRVMA
jgi:hypothetical protein